MANHVIRVVRGLYICKSVNLRRDGQIDLGGVFDTLVPKSMPFQVQQFILFAQLSGGMGDVPFFIEFTSGETGDLIHRTARSTLRFRDRVRPVQMAMRIPGLKVAIAGVDFIELFCHDELVAQTRLMIEPRFERDDLCQGDVIRFLAQRHGGAKTQNKRIVPAALCLCASVPQCLSERKRSALPLQNGPRTVRFPNTWGPIFRAAPISEDQCGLAFPPSGRELVCHRETHEPNEKSRDLLPRDGADAGRRQQPGAGLWRRRGGADRL